MSRAELFAKADELNVTYRKNMSTDDITVLIEEAEMAKKAEGYVNPIEVEEVEEVVKTETKKPAVKGAKPSNVLKPMTPQKSKVIRGANRLVRCIIIPLEESMRSINSEMYSVGTPATGFIKKVVRFNEETIEPMILVNHLRGKKMLLQADTGKGARVKLKRIPAFNIKVLPDYTEEELKELFDKGKASRK